jgi:hypothetical protein
MTELPDKSNVLLRLAVFEDCTKVTAALRIAVEALAFYVGADEDADRAREAIVAIEEALK